MSLLDSLFGIQRLLLDGVELTTRKTLNLIGAGDVAAVDNPTEARTDITLSAPGVADRAALAAIPAAQRYTGRRVLVREDGSLWAFAGSSTASDTAQQLVVTPAAGSGRWLRLDRAVTLALPITFGTADAAVLFTVPTGYVLRLATHPHWTVTTPFTGGSSSSIGVSSSRSGYSTKGDLIGATLEAGLLAGVRPGTIGDKLDTAVEVQALVLEAGNTIRHDRIASAFTAGVATLHVPVIVCTAPAIA